MEGLTSPAKELSTGSGSTIHPTARKRNSRKFTCRILQKSGRIGADDHLLSSPVPEGDHKMLGVRMSMRESPAPSPSLLENSPGAQKARLIDGKEPAD
jgi:hypothetical protein